MWFDCYVLGFCPPSEPHKWTEDCPPGLDGGDKEPINQDWETEEDSGEQFL